MRKFDMSAGRRIKKIIDGRGTDDRRGEIRRQGPTDNQDGTPLNSRHTTGYTGKKDRTSYQSNCADRFIRFPLESVL